VDFNDKLKEISDRVQHTNLSEEQIEYSEATFESIKHINEYEQEFWYARELQVALNYKRWDKFSNVIQKAHTACIESNNDVDEHFSYMGKMVTIGSGATRKIVILLFAAIFVFSKFIFLYYKRPVMILVLFSNTNCLIVTPTHDAYLDNGTSLGLTVGTLIISYAIFIVNITSHSILSGTHIYFLIYLFVLIY